MDAAEIQGKLRACDVSFIDSLRHFGGGVLRGTGAYWADRSGDVEAWLHYRFGRKTAYIPSELQGVAPSFTGLNY